MRLDICRPEAKPAGHLKVRFLARAWPPNNILLVCGGRCHDLRLQRGWHASAQRDRQRRWTGFVQRIRAAGPEVTIGITGKYTAVRDSYASILKALEHSGADVGCRVVSMPRISACAWGERRTKARA